MPVYVVSVAPCHDGNREILCDGVGDEFRPGHAPAPSVHRFGHGCAGDFLHGDDGKSRSRFQTEITHLGGCRKARPLD